MTPTRTPFAGFLDLAPGDALSSENYAFQSQNPALADRLAKIGAVLHRHDAHAAMSDPATAVEVGSAPVGGAIPADTTIYVTYTLTDSQGGETLPVAPVLVTTAAAYATPTDSPDPVINYAAGSLLANTFLYAATVTDGVGGETALGPPAIVIINPTPSGMAEVAFSGLTALTDDASGSSPTAGWRLWRSVDGGNTWDLMGTGAYSLDTFTDDGTIAGDCTVSPPSVGTTVGTSNLTVTVPSASQPAGATFFSTYACTDGLFDSFCLLGVYSVSDFDTPLAFTALALMAGSPPAVSSCFGGANQIDPDTDIIGWPWKQPVATESALPTGGNDGDMRETLDTHTLYVWDAGTSAWEPGGGAVGPAGADGTDGARGSLIYMGEGAPGTIDGQLNDDAYIDTVSGDYYWLVAGTWTEEGSLGGVTVTDGTTTETDVTTLTFSGATVSTTGAGEATVTIATGTTAEAYLQAGPQTTPGQVLLDTVTFDPHGNFDVTTNHCYVCPAAGVYMVVGNVGTNSTGLTGFQCYLEQNGSLVAIGPPSPNDEAGCSQVVRALNCAEGDSIELFVTWSGSGETQSGEPYVYMSVQQLP